MRIGLVTWEGLPGLSEDDRRLVDGLTSLGASVRPLVWSDATVRWEEFDVVVLRSTWDYHRRVEEFLAWGERVAQRTRLYNPYPVVRWNAQKTYLRDLERTGIPIVPTIWGSEILSVNDALARRGWSRAVLKPAVSASAEGTFLARAEDPPANEQAFRRLKDRGEVLVQPYMPAVDDPGEHSLVFVDGEFSHSVVRAPALSPGSALRDGTVVSPSPAELDIAGRSVRAAAHPTLYARVDLVFDDRGSPRVSEVEMIEPLLYLRAHAPSAGRLAEAILRLGSAGAPAWST